MGRYKAYPEYWDSGVEWLGKIPIHWNCLPIGAILIERKELNKGEETTAVLSVLRDKGVIPYEEKGDIGNKKSDNIERYKIVHPGDLVVNSMNVIIGSVGISKFYGTLSPVYLVLFPRDKKKTINDYIGHTFNIKTFQKWLKRLGYGILDHRLRIPLDNLKHEYLPSPPLQEQAIITAFLDHETAKIDALITKQEKLIELLKEKRQAVISHAVTKGLDPDATMKDSGVKWLGEIPAHWGVKQLRYCARFLGGCTPSKENVDYWDGDVVWVSPKDMKATYLSNSADKISEKALANTNISYIPKNSVLIVVRGMILIRKVPVALTTKKITINQDMKALFPEPFMHSAFLLYLLIGLRDAVFGLVEDSAHGTKCLRTEQLQRLQLPIPPVAEQEQIVENLLLSIDKFDRLKKQAENAINLLKERRTALISAAVTGKIDVRGWKADDNEISNSTGE